MKAILTFILLFVSSSHELFASSTEFTFCGTKYYLASVEVDKSGTQTVTNEYVPLGEDINAWTTLIGVRYWPKAEKVGSAVSGWLGHVRSVLIRNATVFKANGKDNDLIVEAWLAPADHSYVEINLHRFVAEEGVIGVKGYQFAQKIFTPGGRGDVSAFMKQRDSRFAALGNLHLNMHTVLRDSPNQSKDPTP
jgi:hypothetical protein